MRGSAFAAGEGEIHETNRRRASASANCFRGEKLPPEVDLLWKLWLADDEILRDLHLEPPPNLDDLKAGYGPEIAALNDGPRVSVPGPLQRGPRTLGH